MPPEMPFGPRRTMSQRFSFSGTDPLWLIVGVYANILKVPHDGAGRIERLIQTIAPFLPRNAGTRQVV